MAKRYQVVIQVIHEHIYTVEAEDSWAAREQAEREFHNDREDQGDHYQITEPKLLSPVTTAS